MLVSQGIIIKCNYQEGGGGNLRVHLKTQAYNSGSVEQDALPGPLHLLVQIVAILPKNPKMTRKEEAQFLLPPPPTHIPAQAQYTKDRYLKNASYQR